MKSHVHTRSHTHDGSPENPPDLPEPSQTAAMQRLPKSVILPHSSHFGRIEAQNGIASSPRGNEGCGETGHGRSSTLKAVAPSRRTTSVRSRRPRKCTVFEWTEWNPHDWMASENALCVLMISSLPVASRQR